MLEFFEKHMTCLDDSVLDSFEMEGRFGMGRARLLGVYAARCIGKPHCKTKEQIDKFI